MNNKDATAGLLRLIRDTPFESGMAHPTDDWFDCQPCAGEACDTLLSTYKSHLDDLEIMIGILYIIARVDYHKVRPIGLEIVMQALHDAEAEVIECGVRALENWGVDGPFSSINILGGVDMSRRWLQEYVNAVGEDLVKGMRARRQKSL